MAKEKSLSIQAIKKRINDRFFFMTYNKLVENQIYTIDVLPTTRNVYRNDFKHVFSVYKRKYDYLVGKPMKRK